jgi:peptide/nickel transport system substrate-binding protein
MIFSYLKLILIKVALAIFTFIPQTYLAVGLTGSPSTLIPHEVGNDSEQVISDLIFRKLFKYEDGELREDLISAWTISEDKKYYEFDLKPNLFWQDGEQINTDDILYTFSLYPSLIDTMELQKLGDLKFSVKLTTQNAVLPSILTFGIEPQHLSKQPRINPIGSTSYRIAFVEVENGRTKSITLQSFQKDKKFPRLKFRFYDKEDDLKEAYKLGEIDTFFSNSDFVWEGVVSKPINYIGRYFALIFNTSGQKFSSADNRNFIVKSLNKDDLLKRSYYSLALKAQGPISYSPYTDIAFANEVFDPNLKLTPSQEKSLSSIKVLLPNTPDGQQIEGYLRSQWQKYNISLETQYIDTQDLFDAVGNENYDMIFIGHETTPDPDRYTFWHSTQKDFLNLGNFEDLRSDKSLEEGRKTNIQEERQTHYHIFQDVMRTKNPAIFLYHPGTKIYMKESKLIPLPVKIYNPTDILDYL